jgi:hypothetical protein
MRHQRDVSIVSRSAASSYVTSSVNTASPSASHQYNAIETVRAPYQRAVPKSLGVRLPGDY